MKYAITAATGNFGQTAVKELLKLVDAKDVVVVARNLEKAQELFPEVEIRQGSYDSVESMTNALAGVDRVLFISSQPGGEVSRDVQHLNVVEALKNNGVEFVAYTSFPHAQTATSALAQDHKLTEDAIVKAGLKHSFLRNNWYLENEIGFLQSGANNQTAAYWANHQAGWALEREYAEGAVKVLVATDPADIYEFAGPATTYAQLGEALKVATGNDFAVAHVTQNEYIAALEGTGLDHGTAAMFASFQAPIEDGSLAEDTNDLPTVLGHDLLPLSEAIKEILAR